MLDAPASAWNALKTQRPDGIVVTTFRKVLGTGMGKSKKRKGQPMSGRDAQYWLNRQNLTGLPAAGSGAKDREEIFDSMYGYGGYDIGYGRAGYKATTGYTALAASGHVDVVDEQGKVLASKEVWQVGWWEAALAAYPSADPKRIRVPLAHVTKLTEGSVYFNACTFDATEAYLKSLFGRMLHSSDKEWLARHPRATDDGVPFEYMASALHELVEVYGFGLSRVRVKAGMLAASDDHKKWARALGCNPFAMIDHRTTNAEAAVKLGMSEAQADALFRFEYHPEPLRGSVVGEKGWASTTAGGVGAAGGHARYLAPRARPGDWVISVQMAPLNELAYALALVPTEYVARHGPLSFQTDDIRRPDGTPILPPVSYKPADTSKAVTTLADVWDGAPGSLKDPATVTSGPKAPPSVDDTEGLIECVGCMALLEPEDFTEPMLLCNLCQCDVWEGFVCPGCGVQLAEQPPTLSDEASLVFACMDCKAEMLPPNDQATLLLREAVAIANTPF